MKNFIRIGIAVIAIILEVVLFIWMTEGFYLGKGPSGGSLYSVLEVNFITIGLVVICCAISGFCITRTILSIDRGN